MLKLIAGLHHFQSEIFDSQKELFERLAKGQTPDALFITCADSRINPNLITQTNPGDLFILRNAGNIVPPFNATAGGEAATIEFAVGVLGIKDIIICGHSHCGAMRGLIHPEDIKDFPTVKSWLSHAEATRRTVKENYTDLTEEQMLQVATQENVLVQLENLKTHPTVYAALARRDLRLHGWMYKIETGDVFNYQVDIGQFVPVTEASTKDRRKPRTVVPAASI